MEIVCSHIQVQSMASFTCQHLQQLFQEGNRSGTITTTNNGRTYNAVWEVSTNVISVQRDLANIDVWDRFSETLARWSHLGFTNHAEQWQQRLTLQKYNVDVAQPLIPMIGKLFWKIDDLDTDIAPLEHRSKSVEQDVNKMSTPLLHLLEEKKQALFQQARHLIDGVTEDLPSDQLWNQERETRAAIDQLEKHVQQLEKMITHSHNALTLYAMALGSIDVSNNVIIYDAFLMRYMSVMAKIRLFIQNYFGPDTSLSTEDLQGYNDMIKVEAAITDAFVAQQLSTHYADNELLSPPSYCDPQGKDAQKQEQVRLHYQRYVSTFTNVLIDPDRTLCDIKQAAAELRVSRNRWQEQIQLEEKIGQLLHQLGDEKVINESHWVFSHHLTQLNELHLSSHNRAQLLSAEDVELLQGQYHHIERANTLYMRIGQILNDLPGFITLCKKSNYDDKMQSRILHLNVLRKMCLEEVSLTNHALDHMEYFVTVHNNVLQQWSNGHAFSRFKFYEPVSSQLSCPTWLVDEHRLFQQRVQEIEETLWEVKYEMLRNEELLKNESGPLLEKNVLQKTEVMDVYSGEYNMKAKRPHATMEKGIHSYGF